MRSGLAPGRSGAFLCLLLLALAGCTPSAEENAGNVASPGIDPSSQGDGGNNESLFSDLTDESGLDFVHFNSASGRYYFPEVGGPGGALFDYDGDGDLDLYAVQGALLGDIQSEECLFPPQEMPLRDALYRNDLIVRENGEREVRWTNVTAESGIVAEGYGMGAAVGDVDNDGWLDLYVTNFGENQLWRNRGDGTFEEATETAGVQDARWTTSAVFLDFDRDGWLDLLAATYVEYRIGAHRPCQGPTGRQDYCGPQSYRGDYDRLWRNMGDGTFEDFTARAGLLEGPGGSGLGAVTADFNGDGWLDLYIANDLMPNFLWRNLGPAESNGPVTFREEGLLAGSALNMEGKAEASMGVDAGDLDNDGDEDLFMTHLTAETSTVYLNDGRGLFEDRTRSTRMGSSLTFTGFGTVMLDYDNDGWLDLASVNGAVFTIPELEAAGDPFPFGQSNQLFRNLGPGPEGEVTFAEVSAAAGEAFGTAETSRGLSAGDIDNDGDIDLVVFNVSGPARFLRNDTGQDQHWLGLRLVGAEAPRDMLGARVELTAPGHRQMRRVRSGGSYCSANDARVLFGLGDSEEPASVTVQWPSGLTESFSGLAVDQYHVLTEGRGVGV